MVQEQHQVMRRMGWQILIVCELLVHWIAFSVSQVMKKHLCNVSIFYTLEVSLSYL